MINRKLIEKKLRKKTRDQMMDWLNSLDHNDYLEASRIINQIQRETPMYHNDPEYRKRIDESEKKTDIFEASLNKEISDKLMTEVRLIDAVKGVQTGIIKIVTVLVTKINENPHNVEIYKETAREIRKFHIEAGVYDPSLWEDVDLD